MSLTLTLPVATARGILNDPSAVRYSAADLLQYANDSLDQIVVLEPRLFLTFGTTICLANQAIQQLPVATAVKLVSVVRTKSGKIITLADKDALDRYNPNWNVTTGTEVIHWMPVEGSLTHFWVYPPQSAAKTLDVLYTRVPAEYTLTANTGLPNNLVDAIADYIVYRAETRDDEHVNSNRATQFFASFAAKVKGL